MWDLSSLTRDRTHNPCIRRRIVNHWITMKSLDLYLCGYAKSLKSLLLFATAWTVVCQAPLSMGFSRQEYWSG